MFETAMVTDWAFSLKICRGFISRFAAIFLSSSFVVFLGPFAVILRGNYGAVTFRRNFGPCYAIARHPVMENHFGWCIWRQAAISMQLCACVVTRFYFSIVTDRTSASFDAEWA
jgi:hypothetical protein